MPKRKHEGNKEDKWRRKLKKYEKKLKHKRRRHRHYDTEDESDAQGPSALPSPARSRSWRPDDDEIGAAEFPAAEAMSPEPAPPPPEPAPPQPEPAPPMPPPAAGAPAVAPLGAATAEDPHSGSLQPIKEMSPADPLADPELLQALGIFETETTEWGRDILSDLAKRWEPLLKDGLKKEAKEEILKKYLYPKNCPMVKPAVLNPEIAAMLNESAKNRDKRVLTKQGQLGSVLSILGRTMSDILTKSIDTAEVLRFLSDATKLLADSHFLETETRRSLITPMLDKSFIEPMKDRKRDAHLFGDKLSDFIKSSRGLQKTGKLIQSTSSTSNNLNWKNPSPRNQQPRGARNQPNRGSGGKTAPYRRRAPAAPHARAPRAASPSMTSSGNQRHKPAGSATSTKQKQ